MTSSSATAETAASDLGSARAAWRLGLVEELAEIGMELARDLRRRPAEDDAAPEASPGTSREAPPKATQVDPGLAFSRISRAVRLTLTLHEQFDQSCEARAAALQAEAARRAAAAAQVRDRREIAVAVRGLRIESFVRGEIEDRLDRGERLDPGALFDRLDREMLDLGETELLDQPLGQLVERLCADLGLALDWSALSDEQLVELEIDPGRRRLCRRGPPPDGGERGFYLAPAGVGRAPP